jgi:hypothetical protein
MSNQLIKQMKPQIIFKKDRQGELTLDAIKGIAIPRIDGKTILMYPKYKKCRLLNAKRIDDWKEPGHSEIEALFEDTDLSKERTDELLKLNSPAAKFVRGIGEKFNIPSLLTAGAIKKYQKEINALAKQIEGADLLPEGSNFWSCLRSSAYYAWNTFGVRGFIFDSVLYSTCIVVPVRIPSVSEA